MKKRRVCFWLCLLFLCCAGNIRSLAAEQTVEYQFYPVSATIEKPQDGHTYIVRTAGKKENEGFVFTPFPVKSEKQVTFLIDVKGKGEIFSKIQQTDESGTLIKETNTSTVKLSKNWKTVELKTELNQNTELIDIMVLTPRKMTTTCTFRNIRLNYVHS